MTTKYLYSIFLAALFMGLSQTFAANPDGDLRLEILTSYNLIVDSNVESPSTYAPRAVFLGAKICNDGANDLTDVFAYIGKFSGNTPGVYPVESVDESGLGYSYSGTFSLTHEGDVTDASRYIVSIPAGECITQYWLVSYPNLDNSGNSVTGASNSIDDDLKLVGYCR